MSRELPEEQGIEQIVDTELDGGVVRTWEIFENFTKIPRKTGEEAQIKNHLIDWATTRDYLQEEDAVGNLLIFVPASDGLENAPGVILQAHMDMVCVAAPSQPDPATHGVTPRLSENGEWLMGTDTTLGADNGVGLAAALALVDYGRVKHGPLALMITVKEEDGIAGAEQMNFESKLLDYKYLLNFDSEDEGEATISSAGGGYSHISLPVTEVFTENIQLFNLKISGLKGGHSGIEIGEERLNAIQAMTALLSRLTTDANIHLISLKGGQASNAIPNISEAVIAIEPSELKRLRDSFNKSSEEIMGEAKEINEKALKIELSQRNNGKILNFHCLSLQSTRNLLGLLANLPHGVLDWSKEVSGLVETSTNLALVEKKENKVEVTMMTRSSVTDSIKKTRDKIKGAAVAYGAEIKEPETFSGWPANAKSRVVEVAKGAWEKVSKNELKVLGTHAGLECGAILNRYPHLEGISVGPTIKDPHTTEEKVKIKSVATFVKFAEELVAGLAS